MPADPNIIEKIKKLLRTEQNGGATEAEAATALAMAQKLAMKHGVDLAEVEVAEITGTGEPFVSEDCEVKTKNGIPLQAELPTSHKWIARILQRYFAVDVITVQSWKEYTDLRGRPRSRRVKTIQLHGRKSNVAIAGYVYSFLYNEFRDRWVKQMRANPELTLRDRNGFFMGLYNGLDHKLSVEKGRNEAELQAQITTNQSTALVLLKEDEKREAALKEAHPRLRYVSVDDGEVNNYEAHLSGRQQGREINIRPALES